MARWPLFARTEAAAGAGLPQFAKNEFDAFLECGILAHGFLRLRCDDRGHDKLVAFSCKRRGLQPLVRRAAYGPDRSSAGGPCRPHVPVRQWVLSWPMLLRLPLAAQPKLGTPVLQVVQLVITRFLLGQAAEKADEADSGAVTLIQSFGTAANLNIHLHCLVCRYITRPALASERVQTNAAGQVVLKLKNTVHAFSADGVEVLTVPRCREPRIVPPATLQCRAEAVDAQGRLRLWQHTPQPLRP